VGEVLQLQLHSKQELAQARYLWIKANHQLEQVLIQDSQQQYILTFLQHNVGSFITLIYRFIRFILLD